MEREDPLSQRGRGVDAAHAELLGVERVRGSLEEARREVLGRYGLSDTDIGFESFATPDGDKALFGEFHGAWGAIALCAALVRRDASGCGWSGRPHALVHAFGERDEHFFVVLKDPRFQEAG